MITSGDEQGNFFVNFTGIDEFTKRPVINRRRSGGVFVNSNITGVKMFKIRLTIFKYIISLAAAVIGSSISVNING